MPPAETVWTVVVAGGSGQRFGAPKQFESLGDAGTPRVIDVALATAKASSDGVVVVVPAASVDRERDRLGADPASALRVAAGGSTRSQSVRAGLAEIPDDATIICVHDAARPFATEQLFTAVIDAVIDGADGAVPASPVADTIKVVGPMGLVVDTPDRTTLVAVQTPQAFRAEVLRSVHLIGAEATDDAALVERAAGRVVVVPAESDNDKITHPEDLEQARRRWAQCSVASVRSSA